MTDEKIIRKEMKQLLAHFDDKKLDNIYYLKFRWADESEYEDFEEYKDVVKKHLSNSVYKFISLDKRFKLTVENTETNNIFAVSFKNDGVSVNYKQKAA